jgi:hypothetical protein
MVTGIAQAWVRSGHQPPLEQRWRDAVTRLRKLAPAASVGGPFSEIGLDQIEAEIVRLTKPFDATDPALRAATEEVQATEARYHRAWASVRDLQKQLQRSAKSDVHRLLGDLPPDCFLDPGPPLDTSSHPWPRFRSTREARLAGAELLARVLELEGRLARLQDALHTTNEPDEVLNRKMIMKLWERVQVLEQRQVPAAPNGAGARAAEAIAADPTKSDRELAHELGVGKDTVRRARNKTGAQHAPINQRKGK